MISCSKETKMYQEELNPEDKNKESKVIYSEDTLIVYGEWFEDPFDDQQKVYTLYKKVSDNKYYISIVKNKEYLSDAEVQKSMDLNVIKFEYVNKDVENGNYYLINKKLNLVIYNSDSKWMGAAIVKDRKLFQDNELFEAY